MINPGAVLSVAQKILEVQEASLLARGVGEQRSPTPLRGLMKLFELEIVSPEREFYRGKVESVGFLSPDGQVSIWADHAPMVAPLEISGFRFKAEGAWRSAFIAEGFLKVSAKGVSVFTEAVEWPENIDVERAKRAKARAEEELKSAATEIDKAGAQRSLARAEQRIKVAATK